MEVIASLLTILASLLIISEWWLKRREARAYRRGFFRSARDRAFRRHQPEGGQRVETAESRQRRHLKQDSSPSPTSPEATRSGVFGSSEI